MGAGVLRMVDQVMAAARRPPLEAAQLIDQPLEVQELYPAGVEQRQRVAVDVRLRNLAKLVLDAMAAKRLADPFAGVSIANHLADAVGLEQRCRKLRGRGAGIERRLDFLRRVEKSTLSPRRCAIARVIASLAPPDGSTNPRYETPAAGGISNTPYATQPSMTSWLTKAEMSVRNSA